MPLLQRNSSPATDGAIPIHTGFFDSKDAGFPDFSNTSPSRPLSVPEQWIIWNYEAHACKCARCHDAYKAHRKGESLCKTGQPLAEKVATFIYSKDSGKTIFDATQPPNRPVRLQVPNGYGCLGNLMKAMERSQRHPKSKPIVSTYAKPIITYDEPVSHSQSRPTTSRRPSMDRKNSDVATTVSRYQYRPSRSRSNSMSAERANSSGSEQSHHEKHRHPFAHFELPKPSLNREKRFRPGSPDRRPHLPHLRRPHRSADRRDKHIEVVDWPEDEDMHTRQANAPPSSYTSSRSSSYTSQSSRGSVHNTNINPREAYQSREAPPSSYSKPRQVSTERPTVQRSNSNSSTRSSKEREVRESRQSKISDSPSRRPSLSRGSTNERSRERVGRPGISRTNTMHATSSKTVGFREASRSPDDFDGTPRRHSITKDFVNAVLKEHERRNPRW